MFVHKPRWSDWAAALVFVGGAAAFAMLMELPAPAGSPCEPQGGSGSATSQLVRDRQANGIPKALPHRDVRDPSEEEERAADGLEALRVEAEFLEVEVESARQRIPGQIISLETMQRSRSEPDPHPDEGVRERNRQELDRQIATTSRRLEEDKRAYRDKRLKLARMKRQIARQAKSVNEPDSESPALRDVIRRLERIEARLDQLAKSAKGPANP